MKITEMLKSDLIKGDILFFIAGEEEKKKHSKKIVTFIEQIDNDNIKVSDFLFPENIFIIKISDVEYYEK